MMLVVQSVAWSVSQAFYDDNGGGENSDDNNSGSMDTSIIDVNVEPHV